MGEVLAGKDAVMRNWFSIRLFSRSGHLSPGLEQHSWPPSNGWSNRAVPALFLLVLRAAAALQMRQLAAALKLELAFGRCDFEPKNDAGDNDAKFQRLASPVTEAAGLGWRQQVPCAAKARRGRATCYGFQEMIMRMPFHLFILLDPPTKTTMVHVPFLTSPQR
jgi:hypothetical protein